MKFANLAGRLHVVRGTRALDVGKASEGRLPADPAAAYSRWAEVTQWAAAQPDAAFTATLDEKELGAPSPTPPQVFVLGLNYRSHAEELGWGVPEVPMVFTKFPSSVTGPDAEVEITGPKVDWEVELVVVIGKGGHRIAAKDAWDAVAGFTVGQDVSDRDVQVRPKDNPQHGLGKSFKGFSPTGPVLTTLDELKDPENLGLRCWVNGELVQDGRTDDFVFSIPYLIEYLSDVVTLLPGDLIFTGTPSGVGVGRTPPRFLSPGDEVRSEIDGIGEMTTRFVPRP
jgi:2-keto-4-pentenoate hydratase/2-oxohepta-3-ene-1,7-dioic acid hydratase in catechol pathway